MYWKFDFIIEGKNLEKVMSALAGVALEMKPPVPVSNAMPANGKKLRQQVEGTTNVDRLMNKLISDGMAKAGEFISSTAIQEAMAGLHISKGSYGTLMSGLKSKGFLTATERRGTLKFL